jgi:phospho-N-acetylmuramoyl-pentapeptide-transferase
VAVAFVFLLRRFGYLTPNLYLPFWNVTVPIPEVLYFILAAFIIVGCVNAVNLTDGVDGLAAGTSLPVMLCYAAVAFKWGREYLSLGIFASGLLGGLLGFLIYNFNPAKVFMGDTGSLFLGGAVCALAFAMDMPLVLIPLGLVFIVETLSDIIQVGYFKLSHGKRVFRMAPFHHHLEMGGWTGKKWEEKELFALYTLVSAVFAVISFFGISGRF